MVFASGKCSMICFALSCAVMTVAEVTRTHLSSMEQCWSPSVNRRRQVQHRSAAFIDPSPLRRSPSPPFLQPSSPIALFDTSSSKENDVKVGSSEYYKGFVARSIDEEPAERITGDAVLIPTMKFVGGATLVLLLLTAAFLASNGII